MSSDDEAENVEESPKTEETQQQQDETLLRWVQEETLQDALGRSGVYTGNVLDQLPHTTDGTMVYENDKLVVKYNGSWKHGYYHDKGTLVLQSGDVYRGEFVKSQRHGQGTYTWADGQREYVGEFEHDQRHGQGKYTWAGAVYQGTFYQNQRQGYGKYVDRKSNVEYQGEWQQGMYEGYGSYQWKDKYHKLHAYRGNFAKGKPHGHGTEVNPDGTIVHDGNWHHGKPVKDRQQQQQQQEDTKKKATSTSSIPPKQQQKPTTIVVHNHTWMDPMAKVEATYRGLWDTQHEQPTGNGTAEYLEDADLERYDGCFRNGHYHGHGRMQWRNGDYYEGDFYQGHRHGKGQYRWSDGRQYSGDFYQNQRHGQGSFLYKNSDFYEGEFVNGKRQGNGRFIFADGSLFEGEWKNGQYHGSHGTLVHSDGKMYIGGFANGVAHGHGKEIDSTGKVTYEGEWVRGQRGDLYHQEQQQNSFSSPTKAKTGSHQQHQRSGSKTSSVVTPEAPKDVASAKQANDDDVVVRPPPPKPQIPTDTRECEAVVDQPIQDAQGNPGRYTGIVLKETQKPHGVGRLVYADGRRIHEGFWKEGSKEGHGRCLFFPQGDFHEGEYKNNLRHGSGRYQWKDGRSYVGEYKDDMRHGHGVFTYPTGERYDGLFSKGQRNGFGRFDFDRNGTGGHYEGEWIAGKYHGKGRLVWGEDSTYEGEFAEGMFHGNGVKTDSNGMVLQRGRWIQGRFQGTKETNERTDSDGNGDIQQSESLDEYEKEFVVQSPAVEDVSEEEAQTRQRSGSECDTNDEEPEEADADHPIGPSLVEVEQ